MQPFLRNKTFSTIIIGIVLVTNIFVLMRPEPVHAQLAVVNPTQDANTVWEKIQKGLVAGGLGALVQGASYFMRKLAYDGAKYLASSAAGQKPLVFQEGFGTYLEHTGDAALGAAIEELGKPFGLDLCKPPDIRIQMYLQVSLSQIYSSTGPKEPDCSWTKFASTWGDSDYWEENYSGDALTERFATSLSVTQGDFGVALGAMGKIDRNIVEKKEANILERTLGEGYKPVKDAISGKILTPSQFVKEESTALTAKQQANQSNQQLAGIYAADAWQIFPTALSIFANTFISSLLDNIMNDGLLPADSKTGANVLDAFASNVNYNRQAAERAFSYLTAGNPQIDATAYDIITRYSSCPDDPGLDNCVMDNGLVQVLQRSKNGDTMTIAEAIEEGLLHGDWKLLGPSREADNTDFGCYNEGYCYSNVQKLRKAGILPIGFEVAILKSNPDNPVTLGEVVGNIEKGIGFYDCDDPQNPSPDPAHPYCHLIDPNWLVKAPWAQCTAKVNGPELLSENVGQRRQECADFSTCIAYDDTGSCIKYGYCTQEKNTWRIPGESCDEQFNTCQTFTNNTTGDIGSYLTRSVDYGTCNAESVGCRGYSLEQDAEGNWLNSTEINIDDKIDYGHNQLAYFNTAASQYACSEADNGCNLYVDNNTQQKLYLKKAPDYLKCYDTDPNTSEVDWVETKADFQLLADVPEQCNNFAGACIAEEVGCESYSPQNGGFDVTGIVQPENICQSECIGYDTFKQEASAFEESRFPLYFIPSQGETCSAQYSGCDAFVDLGDNTGEQIAHFSEIKHCARPDGDNSKVFYTWEGSESEGYVLKKHTLLKEVVGNKEVPAYNGSADPALTVLCNEASYNALLENPYDPAAAPTDCRAYYDDAGDISYRLKEYTVTVSDQCTTYRKVEPYFAVDGSCTNGGTLNEVNGVKECIYNTIISEAQVCPASANRCRSYIGNTGNNVFDLYNHSFEPNENEPDSLAQAKEGWSTNTSVAPEATQVGLYSLRVDAGDAIYSFDPEVLRNGIQYEVSFWARGVPQQLEISLVGDNDTYDFTKNLETNENIFVPIDTEWREYKLGPIPFEDMTIGGSELVFSRVAGDSIYFIDNITFTSVGSNLADYIHIKKDSWKTPEGYDVPQVCDSNPTDAFPGEHLGCQLYDYTRAPNESVALNGFDKICRSEAVGCTEVIDTRNTTPDTVDDVDTTHKLAYNLECRQGDNETDSICTVSFTNEEYSCTFQKGKSACYLEGPIDIQNVEEYQPLATVDKRIYYNPTKNQIITGENEGNDKVDGAYITASTIIISEDSDPQYLTQFNIATGDDYLCNSQALGCQEVGREYQGLPSGESAYTHSSTYLRVNDASLYGQTLCTGEQSGCSQFTSKSQISFFKDPLLSGRPLCNYKEGIELSGVKYSGWFMDGVGQCSDVGTGYCRSDDECPGDTNTCEGIGIQACYQDYLLPGSEYGLWSNGSDNYDNFVGTCDITQNGCTELIDPADTANVGGEGQAYYVLDNDRLYQNIDDCKGNKVSQKEGCILFNRTSNPNKPYDSASTYVNSTNEDFDLVEPVRIDPTQGDSNMVLKVIRDRQCSEWLACRSSVTIVDERGKSHELCQEYQACSELDASGDCTKWVHSESDNQRLTESKYISRGVSWYDSDYTGYSIFNAFNPSNFVYLLFPGHDDAYLGYEADRSLFTAPEDVEFGCTEFDASVADGGTGLPLKEDGATCGYENAGRCYRQKCLYPINGTFSSEYVAPVQNESDENKQKRIDANVERILDGLTQASCKNYPEPNSPFDSVQATGGNSGTRLPKDNIEGSDQYRREFSERLRPFERAEICQISELVKDGKDVFNTDCSCEYLKVEYKNGTIDYWDTDVAGNDVIPNGICSGANEGAPCDDNSVCVEGDGEDIIRGICSKKVKQGEFIGQKGLCMEYDLSRPLTRNKEGKKMYEQFACLTWLPIQVSASAVDLYNVDPEAGYYPVEKYDGEFGELYCLNATMDGRYYDTAVGPDNFSDMGKTFLYDDTNENVKSKGLAGLYLVDDDIACDSTGYHDSSDCGSEAAQLNLSCDSINGLGNDKNKKAGDDYVDKTDKIDHTYGGRKNISDFPPALCQDDLTDAYHMLRSWTSKVLGNETSEQIGGTYVEQNTIDLKGNNSIVLRIEPRVLSIADSTNNNVFAPMLNQGDVSELNQSINPATNSQTSEAYYTDIESKINESDIEKLCFVPIQFPGGYSFGEFMPTIMEDNICIRPQFLKNTKTNGYLASIDQSAVFPDSHLENDGYEDAFNDDEDATWGDNKIEFPLDRFENNAYVWSYYREKTNRNRYEIIIYDDKESDDVTSPAISGFPVDKATLSGITLGDIHPFSMEASQKQRNWLAIAVEFDDQSGEFMGYESRFYHGSPGSSGIRFAVVATLQNKCVDVASVHDSSMSITAQRNKAWTEKTWGQGEDIQLTDATKRTTGRRPYGSLPLLSNVDLDTTFRQFSFFDAFFDGVPLACQGAYMGMPSSGNSNQFCNNIGNSKLITNITNANSSYQKLHTIFALYMYRGIFNSTANKYDKTNNLDISSDLPLTGTLPPHIYSVNYQACDEGHCSAAEIDSFTLNKRNYSLADYDKNGLADENKSGLSAPDPIIAYGSYPAVAQFYAIADDNHMPIRRVMVDWDDGTPVVNDGRYGSYKNRKPYCGGDNGHMNRCIYGTNNAKSYMTCGQDTDCEYLFDPDEPLTIVPDDEVDGVGGESELVDLKRIGEFYIDNLNDYNDFISDGNKATILFDTSFDPNDFISAFTPNKIIITLPTIIGDYTISNQTFEGFDLWFDPTSNLSKTQKWSAIAISPFVKKSETSSEEQNNQTSQKVAGACYANTSPNFGDATRACKEEYFEFSHLYYCDQIEADKNGKTPSEIRSLYPENGSYMFPSQAAAVEAADRLVEQGVDDTTEKVCIFKPGIQILDNWGWCNGVGLDGSYVEWQNYDSSKECNDEDNAYTPYQGAVILIPDTSE